MNWDTVKGDWKQFQGKVKEQWGKLTDDDLKRIEGRRDQLAGTIQKRYGIEKDEAEKQVAAFEQTCEHGQNEEHRPQMESHGREMREKNMMGQAATNNPNKDGSESMPMRHDPRRQLAHARGHFDACRTRLDRTIERMMEARRGRLTALAAQLNSLSPLAVLDRGYALVLDANGALVRSARQVAAGDSVVTRLSDGAFGSRVESVSPADSERNGES